MREGINDGIDQALKTCPVESALYIIYAVIFLVL